MRSGLARPLPAPAGRFPTARLAVAGTVLAVTLLVIAICVVDAVSVPDPPRSNIRFADGRYRVVLIAAGDVLDRAGVLPGDVIVALDGRELSGSWDLWHRYRARRPGAAVSFTVLRAGVRHELTTLTRPPVNPAGMLHVLLPVALLVALGGGVFLLRPELPAALLLLLYCAATAINDVIQIGFIVGTSWSQRLATAAYCLFSLLGPALLAHLFLVFPHRGRLQRRLQRGLPLLYGVALALGLDYWLPTLLPSTARMLSAPRLMVPLLTAFSVASMASYAVAAISVVAVLRTQHDPWIRSQARILSVGLVALAVLHAILVEAPLAITGRSLVDSQALCLVDLVVPLAVAAAIVARRLFGIDVLIRHGLVYGLASAAVAATFIALMAGLGWLTEHLLGTAPGVLLAIAAALAAILFQPVRGHAQVLVDRVLYRRRYDYRRLLTEIGDRLIRLVELGAIVSYLHQRLAAALEPSSLATVLLGAVVGDLELYDRDGLATGRVADSAALIAMIGTTSRPFAPQSWPAAGLPRPAMVVPLVRGDERIGAILLGPRPGELPFLPEDVDFLATLASLAAGVLESGRLHEERAARERLALLGAAASNVIHELKNPLGAMRSTLAVLRRRLDDERSAELTRIVDSEIDRLQERVVNVLGFVRHSRERRVPLQLDDLARELAPVVEPELDRLGIRLDILVEAEPAVIKGDPDRLRQALLNLLLNSREALSGAGRIELVVAADGEAAVVLRVADDGPGFSSDALGRACEPFFTTKTLGTGIGLANVRRIVEEHGGTITLANRPAGGAAVTLRFPAAGFAP